MFGERPPSPSRSTPVQDSHTLSRTRRPRAPERPKQQARWLDAINELEAARDIRATPPVMYNLGLAQRAVGRNREAVESFRAFLQMPGHERNPELVPQAEQFIRELGSAVGEVELRIEPSQAAIEVDGQPVERRGGHLALDPGRHVVSATAEGFARATQNVTVTSGGTTVLVMRLVPESVTAHLRVDSSVRDATIRVDGRDVGIGTVEQEIRAGHHTIEVRAEHFAPFRREIDAVTGRPIYVNAQFEERHSVLERPWFWIATGAAVVVVAAAVTTTVVLTTGPASPYSGSWGLVTDAITVDGRR
jgi:hypothetical protein